MNTYVKLKINKYSYSHSHLHKRLLSSTKLSSLLQCFVKLSYLKCNCAKEMVFQDNTMHTTIEFHLNLRKQINESANSRIVVSLFLIKWQQNRQKCWKIYIWKSFKRPRNNNLLLKVEMEFLPISSYQFLWT